MKKLVIVVSMLLFGASIVLGQTARSYYDELYKAGGLDRMADGYVCFDDDPIAVRGYSKGVPLSDEETFDKDNDSWVEKARLNKTTEIWVRLDISWQTLRYRKSVEVRNLDSKLRYETSRYGRCEEIPPTIRQRAN